MYLVTEVNSPYVEHLPLSSVDGVEAIENFEGLFCTCPRKYARGLAHAQC